MEQRLGWTENWGRSYRITLGTREYRKLDPVVEAATISAPSITLEPKDSDYNTIPSNAVFMSNLEEDNYSKRGFSFKFNSNQKASSKGGEGENSFLELYNLSPEVVEIINKDKCIVMIELGYQQKVSLVYSGDVVEVTSRRQGADMVYRIKCSAGSLPMRNTLSSLSYEESLSDGDIILDMVSRFPGTALGTYGLGEAEGTYKVGGNNFTGKLATNFDKMMEKHHLNYSYINGKIVIIPYRFIGKDYDTFARTNYNLPEDTLKGVTPITDNSKKSSTDIKAKLSKLQINTFFIPIEIGQFVTVPESSYNNINRHAGTYVVKGRRLILNSQGGSWDVVLEVEEV